MRKKLLTAAAIAACILSPVSRSAAQPAEVKPPEKDPSLFDHYFTTDQNGVLTGEFVDGKPVKTDDDTYLATDPFDSRISRKQNLALSRLPKCNLSIENGPCYVILSKDEPALPSIRVDSKSGRVEILVYRSPLERVEYDSTTTLQLEPDVGAAILKQWIDPLKALTIYTRAPYINNKAPLPVEETGPRYTSTGLEVRCTERLQLICDTLDKVAALQKSTRLVLVRWSGDAEKENEALTALKSVSWKPGEEEDSTIHQELKDKLIAARTALGNAQSSKACPEAPDDDYSDLLPLVLRDELNRGPANTPAAPSSPEEKIPAARCLLPVNKVAAAHELLLMARSLIAGYTLEPKPDLPPNATAKQRADAVREEAAERRVFQRNNVDVLNLIENQVKIESAINDAKTAQDKLAAAGDKLKEVSFDADLRPLSVKKIASPRETAITQVKIKKTGLLNAKTSEIAAPAIQWQHAKWELSAGVSISTLKKRSFGVAPELNATGAPTGVNRIAKTSTSPAVFPVAYAHYRFGNELLTGLRRSAILGTFGIGANDGSAEAFGGASYSYGGFFVSVGGHLGRLKKLGADLEVDKPTTIASGDLSKFEKKGWVVRPAISFSYRVPIP